MTIGEFLDALDRAIPLGAKYGDDAVGLQFGDRRSTLRGVMVAHDLTESAVNAAVRRGANLIVCYHPVIFAPITTLAERSPAAFVPLAIVRAKLAVYVVHTAFDTHPVGTNMLLAKALSLQRVAPLVPLRDATVSITTHVPGDHANRVAEAMWNAGGGTIGEYRECSFQWSGIGTFRPGARANPQVGRRGARHAVEEVRLSMVCPTWRVPHVTAAMRAVHPYEEVAFEVVALRDAASSIGMGAVGELRTAQSFGAFLGELKRVCTVRHVRTNGRATKRIRRVAIVGGSGGSFLNAAIAARADVFVTGDVKYHTFHEAGDRIALVDAGHRETERFVVAGLTAEIRRVFRSLGISHIRVVRASITNDIFYV